MWEQIIWNDEPDGNVAHIAEHGLTEADVEHVLQNPRAKSTSRTTGKPCVFGYTPERIFINVVYEEEEGSVYPITTYPVEQPR